MEQRIHEVEQITDLKDMLNKSAIKFSEKPAFKFKTEKVGEFRVITYSQFKSEVDALGTTLIQLGMKGKKIAVISENEKTVYRIENRKFNFTFRGRGYILFKKL